MSDTTVIKVHALSKTFRLPHEKVTSVKSAVVNFYKRDKKYEEQLALDDISLEVKKGEFFGVIGRNGSGKSTLMKLLAGIYEPTAGSISIDGKLTPFIELGVGFNPELTGRENVFLNGALLGFNRKEMLEMYDEIVAFSEIGRFMDQKLKNYSSGMQVRLAFSIAIRAKTDILLLDEVLAVGDQNFQDKCFKYFEKIKKTGTTVVFISHDSAAIERFCDRVAIIDRSKLVDIGDPRDMVFKYSAIVAEEEYTKQESTVDTGSRQGTGKLTIKKVYAADEGDKHTHVIKEGKPFKLRADFVVNDDKKYEVIAGFDIIDREGVSVLGPNTSEAFSKPLVLEKSGTIEAAFDSNPIASGEYSITAAIFNSKATYAYDLVEQATKLNIIGEVRHGKVYVEPKWSITETS